METQYSQKIHQFSLEEEKAKDLQQSSGSIAITKKNTTHLDFMEKQIGKLKTS